MNFDPIADRYDQTRALPEGVPERVRDQIVASVGATDTTRFLEPGIGTGRIALPFILAGYDYTGVDLSERMMARLREKMGDLPNRLTLLQSDVTALPFPDHRFDAAIVVHVLHLVSAWRQALAEIRRVTAPGGWLALASNSPRPGQEYDLIRERWYEYARGEGATIGPRHSQLADVEAALTDQGCLLSQYVVAGWENRFRPIDVLDALRARIWSQTWSLTDDLLERSHSYTVAWATERYGDLTRELTTREELVVTMARWPDSPA